MKIAEIERYTHVNKTQVPILQGVYSTYVLEK